MQYLELLAPARNADIGIAAIDCGADAVYIGAPAFGARKDAGNSVGDIARLCAYASQFGVRIFVTFNTLLRESEKDAAHAMMLEVQDAGASAFIVRDPAIFGWDDIRLPLHASTQCAIRDIEGARRYVEAGCSRIVLERQLSLDEVRKIAAAVDCEIEFFVHGALCVGYSGECRLSEYIDGRSADRGECIQACRSLYDLVDGQGKVLARNKALLSLKDYRLRDRLEELADAGVCSFKIEGRLKNESYVRNVVRDYDLALNALVAKYPERYRRASFGTSTARFVPDTDKTFNRGYTELYIDGKRDRWAAMDAPKSMGEPVGRVKSIHASGDGSMLVELMPAKQGLTFHNGDGFAFVGRDGIKGFRADVCNGLTIRCKETTGLTKGCEVFRNYDKSYEEQLRNESGKREIRVRLDLDIHGKYAIDIHAGSEDGRQVTSTFNADLERAQNSGRMLEMLRGQLSKRSGHYKFEVGEIRLNTPSGSLPLLSSATINGMRRMVAEDIESLPCNAVPLKQSKGQTLKTSPKILCQSNFVHFKYNLFYQDPLMLSKYCVRYELGMCPRHHGAKNPGKLYLLNNGVRLELNFDCASCQMSVRQVEK